MIIPILRKQKYFSHKFITCIQAKRVKEQHGKLFAGFMIGVTPCLNKEINETVLSENLDNSTFQEIKHFVSFSYDIRC